ncbi:MAG TPA: hypothetical protein VFB16_08970 [Bauldia sp.]|nr:hypothetical protein [Bauldia sp.]
MRKFLPAVAALGLILGTGSAFAATESGVISHVGPGTITLSGGKIRTFEVGQTGRNAAVCYDDRMRANMTDLYNDGCLGAANSSFHVGERVAVKYVGGRGGAIATQVIPLSD